MLTRILVLANVARKFDPVGFSMSDYSNGEVVDESVLV